MRRRKPPSPRAQSRRSSTKPFRTGKSHYVFTARDCQKTTQSPSDSAKKINNATSSRKSPHGRDDAKFPVSYPSPRSPTRHRLLPTPKSSSHQQHRTSPPRPQTPAPAQPPSLPSSKKPKTNRCASPTPTPAPRIASTPSTSANGFYRSTAPPRDFTKQLRVRCAGSAAHSTRSMLMRGRRAGNC